MAINHADGQLFGSVPLYPIAAGLGAAHGGAGWFTVLFIPVGLALGIGICVIGRAVVYSISGFGLSRGAKIHNRGVQTVFFFPFFVLYVILPVAIACGGVFGIWAGSVWIARHLF